ncbi:class I SAM-dependent methyltransferase [Actinophytocola oryzae]|nr:class I SAM-dependent methyltransferase [Actinophytocola oryzae]
MAREARWQRFWDRSAPNYDRQMAYWERKLFRDSRQWACGQATGDVLEVAVGTGLNLPFYPEDVAITGLDLSDGMLELARARGRAAVLQRGDAHDLPFRDGSFDTVVCTFGLCAIPDPDRAVGEMVRVLRPDGRLILVDHVAGTSWPVRTLQWLLERVTVPLQGEHFLRRPFLRVQALGLHVEQRERFARGVVERLVARKGV